jgi:hypothetical protein
MHLISALSLIGHLSELQSNVISYMLDLLENGGRDSFPQPIIVGGQIGIWRFQFLREVRTPYPWGAAYILFLPIASRMGGLRRQRL